MNYIATFFTHSGAIKYKKQFANNGIYVELRPVPRELSSSCGVAGVFSIEHDEGPASGDKPDKSRQLEAKSPKDLQYITEEVEKLYSIGSGGYELLFENE